MTTTEFGSPTPIRRSWSAVVRSRYDSRPMQFLRRSTSARVAAGVLVVLIAIAAFAPLIAPYDPAQQDLFARYAGPSASHWLGQDEFGRDVLSRLIFGLRTSLWATLQALALATALGVPIGLIAGFAGGRVDAGLSRVAEATLAMPPLILAMAIVAALGAGLTNAMIALGIVIAPVFFRVARAAALSVSNAEYVEAARSVGCRPRRILARHILPNSISPLIVQISFTAGIVIIAEASLSFLGLGAQPPTASLGSLVRDGFNAIYQTRFLLFPPCVLIVIIILALTVLGDALRDAFSAGSSS